MLRTSSTAVPRQDLLGAYYEFNKDAEYGLIGDMVLPVTEAPRRFTTLYSMPRKEWYNRVSDVKRARKSAASRSEAGIDNDTMTVLEYIHEEPVDDLDADEFGDFIPLEEIAARRIARKIEVEAEVDAAAVIFDTATFTGSSLTAAVATNWATAATAVPITDIVGGVYTFLQNWGVMPNACIMSMLTYLKVCATTQVQGRFLQSYGPTTNAIVPEEAFQTMINVPGLKLYLPFGMYDSTDENTATPTMTQIWGRDKCMLTRVGSGNDLDGPQIGRTFVLPGKKTVTIDQYREEQKESTIVRARRELVRKRMKNACGLLLTGCNGGSD